MTAWHLFHISMHPETQERIYDELSQAMKENDGAGLTTDIISQSKAPYLHAAFRESHRLTNPAPLVPIKKIYEDVTIHGVTIPAGNVVIFDSLSKSRSNELLDNPDKFIPDRFLSDAVQARKGTPAEVLDHPLFRGPFSEGARKCPGSRVSKNESLLLIAQLILDYQMTNPLDTWRDVKYRQDTTITPILPKIEFLPR